MVPTNRARAENRRPVAIKSPDLLGCFGNRNKVARNLANEIKKRLTGLDLAAKRVCFNPRQRKCGGSA